MAYAHMTESAHAAICVVEEEQPDRSPRRSSYQALWRFSAPVAAAEKCQPSGIPTVPVGFWRLIDWYSVRWRLRYFSGIGD